MLTTINPDALARYRAKKESERKQFIIRWHDAQSHYMEDVLADYWDEYIERQELISYSNRAKAKLEERLASKKTTATATASTTTCTALSFVRPSVFSKFELAVLNRSHIQERATERTRQAREQATARALARADKIQPVETTDCYRAYKPHVKHLKVYHLHDGQYHLIKQGVLPVRFHIERKQDKFVGMTYKHAYTDRGKVKNMKNPSFVIFPDDTPIETTSFMTEIFGQWVNDTALFFVVRALRTAFQASGNPYLFLLLMQAQYQLANNNSLDHNCEVHTTCRTSTRYRDKLTGRMMQREKPVLVQEIIWDDGKMLDYSGLPGETKVNKEKSVFQDIEDLIAVAYNRIVELVHLKLIAIPSDIFSQKGSVYSAVNAYIDASKKRWELETTYTAENEENEEFELDIEALHYMDEYKSHLQAVLDTIKATVAKHTAKQFKLDEAIQAYSLSMDYDNCYIAQFMGKDEKQVRRWIKTVETAINADKEFKHLMLNAM